MGTCNINKDIYFLIFKETFPSENQCFQSFCTILQRICSAIISSHYQIPENAFSEATEADERERNDSVTTAVEWVNQSLSAMLRDLKPTDQCEIDKMLG